MGFAVPAASAAFTAIKGATAAMQASQGLMTALRVASAGMQIMKGMQAKQRYNTQARYRQLEGRVEAVQEKEKGNEILRRIKVGLANNIALSGATGFDIADLTVQGRMNFGVMRPGSIEFSTSQDNQDIIGLQTNRDVDDLRAAGNSALMGGIAGAIGSFANSPQIGTAPDVVTNPISTMGPRLQPAPTFYNPYIRPKLTAGDLFR